MIKFHLVTFRSLSTFKTVDEILIGTFDQVVKYSENYAASYNTDYFIECSSEQLTAIMRGLKITNVANYQAG